MVLFISSMAVKTYAAEISTETSETGTEDESEIQAGQTGTGDKMKPCTVTFSITDKSGGYPGNKIKAIMIDVTGTITDEYTFTPANSWKETVCPKYSVAAPTTYNVTFEGLEDGYAIVDALDNSSDIKIAATSEGSVNVYWSIISVSSDGAAENDTDTSENQLDDGRDNVENHDAEQVFQKFLSQVEFTEKDSTWDNFFKTYKIFSHEEWYGKYVKDAKEEDYLELSLYERFLWDETYLRFCDILNSGDSNMFFADKDSFRTKYLEIILGCMTGNNSEQVKTAYEELAMWQYNYIVEYRVPFNFIYNRSYIAEIDETVKPVETSPQKENAGLELNKEDKKELDQARKELMKEMDKKDIEQENGGVWDDTITLISKNLLTIGVLALLVVVTVIVIWKRKQLNIGEDNKY